MALFTKKPAQGKVGFVPGWFTAAKLPEVIEATASILDDFGVPFLTLPLSSGWELWFAGYEDEFNTHMEATLRELKKKGVTKLLSNDPYEVLCFRERYGIECQHTLDLFGNELMKIQKGESKEGTLLHPSVMQRLGITPRATIRVAGKAGMRLTEEIESSLPSTDFSRNQAELTKKLVKRVVTRAKHTIITSSPYERYLLRKETSILDISEVLAHVE